MDTPRFLVDTTSRGGSPDAALAALQAALPPEWAAPDVVRTTTAGVGAAVQDALADGRTYLVVLGGDDTVHEVVNAAPLEGGAPVVGLVPTGPRCDFAKTFGLDRPPSVLARRLSGDAVHEIDVGVVEYTGQDGQRRHRRFANVAQVGYGADAVRRQERMPRALGRVGALLSAYAAIRGVPRQDVKVALAHATVDTSLVSLLAANGQFYSDGAKVAPRALPDDDLLNVQVFTGAPSQVFALTSRIYRGEHLPDPDIREYQSATVELAPEIPLAVEADGRYLGTTPVTIGLLPRALRLKI